MNPCLWFLLDSVVQGQSSGTSLGDKVPQKLKLFAHLLIFAPALCGWSKILEGVSTYRWTAQGQKLRVSVHCEHQRIDACTQQYTDKLECGPMPNLMVALPNIGGALCSTPQSLADAHY